MRPKISYNLFDTAVEQYFRSYFADEAEWVAFQSSHKIDVSLAVDGKTYWQLQVTDSAGYPYRGNLYPHAILWREGNEYEDFADIFFWAGKESVAISITGELPTRPYYIKVGND